MFVRPTWMLLAALTAVGCVATDVPREIAAGLLDRAADRLTAQLAASEPFEMAKVDGEVKTTRKQKGMSFNVTIPLDVPGEES